MPRKDDYVFARTHPGVGIDPLTAYNASAAKDGAQVAAMAKPGAPRALAALLRLVSDEDIRTHIECGEWSDAELAEFEWLTQWITSNR